MATIPKPRIQTLPVLPLRDMVVFPGMIVPVLVGRQRSVKAIEECLKTDKRLLLLAQKADAKEDPSPDELFLIGVQAEILQNVKLPEGGQRILLEARSRARVVRLRTDKPFLEADAEMMAEQAADDARIEAAARGLLQLFEEYVRLNPRLSPETFHSVSATEDPGRLADVAASHLNLKVPDKQRLLEILDLGERLERTAAAVSAENQILALQRQLQGKVRKRIEKHQREAFLNEQLKTIQAELGQKAEDLNEAKELRDKIAKLEMMPELKEKALKEVSRLERSQPMSAEATVIRTYLDTLLALPWGLHSKDRLDLKKASEVLEEDHAGLEKPKARVLEHLAVRKLVDKLKGPILCFVGPPGVGKTSLARSIARAMGRKFERISLGGVRDEAEIRGHRRTYIGSMPGRIVQALKRAGTFNPVILLDEVDKMAMDFRGDPASALLEVLDPEQNNAFVDHYLDASLDLSQVLFITTANLLYEIPGPLRDRLEVIEIPGYLDEEKAAIARRFLLPKLLRAHGLKEGQLKISDAVLLQVIHEYTREAGVRELERMLANLCRKAAKHVVDKGARASLEVKPETLGKYLGIPKYLKDEAERRSLVGLANGLAWTGSGGEVLPIEVTLMPGKGGLALTGSLGDVMKESAQAAFSWVRAHAKDLGLPKDFHTRQDIHIHVPAGATPKDGPSAGITMATALASALTGRPVRREVAMTGEITLRGRVLPIGGLKEKSLAAHRLDIHTLIVPRQNRKDLEDIPLAVRQSAKIHLVSSIEQVLKLALEPRKPSLKERRHAAAAVPKVEIWSGSELPQ